MMSRGRWRIWSVCRRGWRGGGIISRRVRGGRNCWRRGWRRFGGFVKGSVEVSSGFSFDPVVVSLLPRTTTHPVAMKPRRGWGTRSCGDLSLLSFATANDTTTLSRRSRVEGGAPGVVAIPSCYRLLPQTTPPPWRDEAAPRVGHPELWRSQLVIVCYRKRHHHPVAMKPRRGWGTRSCGDPSLVSLATANDTTTLSR